MTIKSFHLTSFQSESSPDSNGRLTHYEYDDGELATCEEWQGYHPAGAGGRMPSVRYRLSNEQREELEAAFVDRDLLRSRSETASADDPAPAPPPGPASSEGAAPPPGPASGPGMDSRSYGIKLAVETTEAEAFLESSYTTSGPRVEELEERPLFVELGSLQSFLRDLKFRAEKVIMTPEEREAESFFNRNGYHKGESRDEEEPRPGESS